MPFIDDAAARILKTLLSIFFMRITLLQDRQFSYERLAHSAHRFAQQLDDARTDNQRLNKTAVQIAEGLLFGFYQNRPANKCWTALVHQAKSQRMVKDAYRIAAMLIQQTDSAKASGAA